MSVNQWHGVSKKGVIYKKPIYARFVRSLAIEFKRQLKPIEGYVHIDIVMFLDPSKDTDGPFKPIFDALEEAGILKNDYLNHRGTYDRYDRTEDYDTILVSVKELKRDSDSEQADGP